MDRRIEETQDRLVLALRQLLQEHAWAEITVAMVCARARVARSTFYAHLAGKADLMALSISRLAVELVPEDTRRGLDRDGTFCVLEPWLSHVSTHKDIWIRNRHTAAAYVIAQNLRTTLQGLLRREIDACSVIPDISDDAILFICGGIFTIVERWVEQECHTPKREILRILDRFLSDGALPLAAKEV